MVDKRRPANKSNYIVIVYKTMLKTIKCGLLDWIPKKYDCCDGKESAQISGVTVCPTRSKKCRDYEVFFANERKTENPHVSPIFSYRFDGCNFDERNCPLYYNDEVINSAAKYEDMSRTYDQIVANTSFAKDEPEFNKVVYWPRCDPTQVSVLGTGAQDPATVTDSLQLKSLLLTFLDDHFGNPGLAFMRLRGLACIDDVHSCTTELTGTMLFGFSQLGVCEETAKNTCFVVSMTYSIQNGKIILNDDPKVVIEVDVNYQACMNHLYPGYKDLISLSGLEYDYCRKMIHVLTSYKNKYDLSADRYDMGGYLWTSAWHPFKKVAGPLELVRNCKTQRPFVFCHKPEGIAVIDKNRLIVVHDDDKVLRGGRYPHQFFYEVLEFVDNYKFYKTHGFGYCKDPFVLGDEPGTEKRKSSRRRRHRKNKEYRAYGDKCGQYFPRGYYHPCYDAEEDEHQPGPTGCPP